MSQQANRKSEVLFVYNPDHEDSARAITTGVATMLFDNPSARHLHLRNASNTGEIEIGFEQTKKRLGLIIFHFAHITPTDTLLMQTLKIMEQNDSLAIPLLISSLLPEKMDRALGAYEIQPSRVIHLQIPIIPTDLTTIIRSHFPH